MHVHVYVYMYVYMYATKTTVDTSEMGSKFFEEEFE